MKNWKFAGTLLSDFGDVTVVDDPYDIPKRRGENITIPFAHGRKRAKKYYDERVITFGITISGDTIGAVDAKFHQLKALLSSMDTQELYRETEGGQAQIAQAEIVDSLQPSGLGPLAVKTTVSFLLANPFFRAEESYQDDVVVDASPVTLTITNSGTVPESEPIILLAGPLENTVITNTTNGCILTYAGAIAGGTSVEIKKIDGQWTAILDGSTNVIGNVTHAGDASFMVFDVGNNELEIIDDAATTGSVSIEFYTPYV